jgi:hypothetical protein
MKDKMISARFTCAWEMFGDVEGGDANDWMVSALRNAKAEGMIENWRVLSIEPGIWGIQFILFNVDVLIPPLSHDEAKDFVSPELNKIVHDTDVEILWVSETPKEKVL